MIVDDLKSLAQPIDKLSSLPGNPRRGVVDAIAKSLDVFGQRKPVVARRDGTVTAGNHTLAAALQLGWDELAVVWTDDDETTGDAWALADNHTGDLGGYDNDALAAMLSGVQDADAVLFAATGYSPEDLMALLAGPDFDGPADPALEALAYSIVVECTDERQQARLLTRLELEGFDCRPIAT
jgi:hypothetical protein